MKTQVTTTIFALIIGFLISKFGSIFLLFNPRYWRLCGFWRRYGLTFYKTNGMRLIHKATVVILPIPPLMIVVSFNRTYSYWARVKVIGNNLYFTWRGILHAEGMMSVYVEPLHVNKNTIIIGVKSCITKNGEPAANRELMSKQKLSDQEIRDLIEKDDFGHIIVHDASRLAAHYESP